MTSFSQHSLYLTGFDGQGYLWIWNESSQHDPSYSAELAAINESGKAPVQLDRNKVFGGLRIAVNEMSSNERKKEFGILLLKDNRSNKNLSEIPQLLVKTEEAKINGCPVFIGQPEGSEKRAFRIFDTINCGWGGAGILVGREDDRANLDKVGSCYSVPKALRQPESQILLRAVVSTADPNATWECALPGMKDASPIKQAQSNIFKYTIFDGFSYEVGIYRKLSGKEIRSCAQLISENNNPKLLIELGEKSSIFNGMRKVGHSVDSPKSVGNQPAQTVPAK